MKAKSLINWQHATKPFRRLPLGSAAMRAFTGLLLLSLFLATAACSAGATLDQPPDIRYGEDACDHCGMIINEPRFAASYVTEDGETRRFDDIGNMMAHYAQYNENVAAFWVHDYESEEWMRAEEAHYVVSSGIHTPMGHGVVAFDDAARAGHLAGTEEGRVLDFPELVAYYTGGKGKAAHDHADGHGH
jgi:copper chaperone NosL